MTRARSMLLALAMAVALIAGAPPRLPGDLAFTVLNVALLGLALWLALPRIGGAASLLLFGGPIIWWIDKVQTDVCTFSLLAICLLLVRERPWWAVIAAGAAALLPAYLNVHEYSFHVPSVAELLAAPFDPEIGLAANFPVLVLVVGAAAGLLFLRRPRAWREPDLLVAAMAALGFLVSMAQTTNVHHGGTPGVSRYAIWLMPLSLPLLREARERGGPRWHRFLWSAATVSAVACAFVFHPAVTAYGREPTLVANALWTRHPGWNNPLPEIFSEVLSGADSRSVPVSTAGCEKILLQGRDDGSVFPAPCFPHPVPPECQPAGTLCYANLQGAEYRFVPAPGGAAQHQGFEYQPRLAWPARAVPHVRDLLRQWEWWALRPKTQGEDALRQPIGVRVLELEGAQRLVFILRFMEPDARLVMRPAWKAAGTFVDGMTGQTVQAIRFDAEPFSRWEVPVPSGFDLLLLMLQPS